MASDEIVVALESSDARRAVISGVRGIGVVDVGTVKRHVGILGPDGATPEGLATAAEAVAPEGGRGAEAEVSGADGAASGADGAASGADGAASGAEGLATEGRGAEGAANGAEGAANGADTVNPLARGPEASSGAEAAAPDERAPDRLDTAPLGLEIKLGVPEGPHGIRAPFGNRVKSRGP